MNNYLSFIYAGVVEDDGTSVYQFIKLAENGGYVVFDPTGEGDGRHPVFDYDGIVERFMALAATDPRVAVPPEVYNHYRKMNEVNPLDNVHPIVDN